MQVCTLLQTDKHTSTPPLSFLQAGCPSSRPTNSVKALKDQREAILTSAEKPSCFCCLDDQWTEQEMTGDHAVALLARHVQSAAVQ